eukprot:COSAG06_NODE_6260_length_3009_cov_7.058559_1_plen_72_part_00
MIEGFVDLRVTLHKHNNNNTHASAETRCLVRFVGSCVCCYAAMLVWAVLLCMCLCVCAYVTLRCLSWIAEV